MTARQTLAVAENITHVLAAMNRTLRPATAAIRYSVPIIDDATVTALDSIFNTGTGD